MRGKSGRREALPAPAMRPVAATAVARRAVRLPGMKLIMLKWTNRPLQAVVALLAAIVFVQATASAAEDCAIATAHPLATRAGCDILAKGGNAFDAAIAVTAALAVVEPFASGIGGGGFYLLHRAADGVQTFVDARETAPAGATAAFYLDEQGQPKDRLSLDGPAAAGIPGIPAAIDWIAQRYALLPLQDTIAPAIALARDGFTADSRYVWATGYRASVLNRFANGGSAFLDGGKGVDQGFVVRQPDLARTLSKLAEQGRDGFYRGDVARALVDAVRADGGLWTLDDLAEYAVVERQPYRFGFRGARITTAPLPSSGGLVLAQALQILDQFPIDSVDEAERAHLIVEAMRRGYNDRARYMGDPDFVDVPVAMLGSRDYARRRAAGIDAARATPSSELPSVAEAGGESQQTTHFSIVDRFGNRVAATLSVNGPFGSGFVAGDTGVLLNNHMNDFSLAIAAPNLYKLVGNDANAIAPGKRPLSSMSPTFVEDSRGVLVLGTPGGSRIISMVLLATLDYLLDPVPDIERMVARPRYHHQYLPDRIEIEPGGFPEEWVAALRAKGHTVESGRRKWGNMQVVFVDARNGERSQASDPRAKAGVLF
jgi:gamma-glutamyltranspeptidase / glutathione hydrolase